MERLHDLFRKVPPMSNVFVFSFDTLRTVDGFLSKVKSCLGSSAGLFHLRAKRKSQQGHPEWRPPITPAKWLGARGPRDACTGGPRTRDRGRSGHRHADFRPTTHPEKSSSYAGKSGFIFVRTIFVHKGKCSLFLELIPTLWQMPWDVTNISEDWADFCQCQEFWCHFLSFALSGKWPFWLWEGALSPSQKALSKSKRIFLWESECAKWYQNFGNSKICEGNGEYLWSVCSICQSVNKNFQMGQLA